MKNQNNDGAKASGGIGFCGLLSIAFIVLRLTNVIDWSWWWVLAPLWIPIALAVVIVIAYVVITYIIDSTKEKKK